MQRSAELLAPIERSVPYREAYSVPEVATLLGGASERWVWGLVEQGELPSFKLGGKRLVSRRNLTEFIERLCADEQQARDAAAGPRGHDAEVHLPATPTRHEFGAGA